MAEDVKFAFFATGADKKYPGIFTRLKSTHINWMRDRLARIIKRDKVQQPPVSLITPPARVRFVHYSFQNNKVFVRDVFFGQDIKNPLNKFVPIESVTDGLSDFVRNYSSTLSIVDIYHAVRKAPRKSVIDLSIYSHGFVEGPVLGIDSFDMFRDRTYPKDAPLRDPNDTDGRVRTDFFPNMGEEDVVGKGKGALAEFAGAFADGAAFRLFGCNVQDIEYYTNSKNWKERLRLFSLAKQVIHQAYTLPRLGTGSIAEELKRYQRPTQPVTMHMGHEFDVEDADTTDHFSHETSDGPLTSAHLLALHYDDHPLFVGETARDVSRAYADIIAFVALEVMGFYAFKAAQALPNITVFGALPGTGGDFDNTGAFHLMNVPNRYYFPLRFYEKFLDISLEEPFADRRRNYGIFNATTVAKIVAHSEE